MTRTQPRTDKEIEELYTRHGKTVYRVCYAYMRNPADTEDAVQETFFRLIRYSPAFESEEHEKAWLIRTAANICKNTLRHWWRRRESIEDFTDLPGTARIGENDVMSAVTQLPEKLKTVVYLYYYEGYNSVEIARMLKQPQSTVRTHLRRARAILKERLGEDFDEEQ